jgi:predicted MPP superfamily phosphohydrolase
VFDITTIKSPPGLELAVAAGLSAAAGAIAVYSYFIEPFWLEITHPEIRIPGLSSDFDGFTVAQLSDFHLLASASGREPVFRAVEECNRACPDVVVLTGDYLGRRGALPKLKDVLSRLTARPAFAVFGNHDYRFGRVHRRSVVQAFHDVGITVLDNASTSIARGSSRLWLVGVGDGHTSHDRLSEAMCGLTEQDRPRILLTHYPDLLFELPPHSFDLALAGHTHGAQVRLPYVTTVALRGSDTRFTSGLFEVGGIPLYVNRGLGTSTYRLRFGARPELTLLTLRRATGLPG